QGQRRRPVGRCRLENDGGNPDDHDRGQGHQEGRAEQSAHGIPRSLRPQWMASWGRRGACPTTYHGGRGWPTVPTDMEEPDKRPLTRRCVAGRLRSLYSGQGPSPFARLRSRAMDNLPLTIVICGASGDLTARKLVPSLYRLDRKKRLPAEAKVVG